MVGHGVRDVRQFMQYLNTGGYEGQGHVTHETIATNASGTEEDTLLWKPSDDVNICVFALRGIDARGNKGKFSNIATALTNIWWNFLTMKSIYKDFDT